MPLVVNDEVSWRQKEILFGITGRRGSDTVIAPPPEITSLQDTIPEGSLRFGAWFTASACSKHGSGWATLVTSPPSS